MGYVRVTNTRSGRAAISYAFEEQSHKKGMDRVLMASGNNLDPDFAMQQMNAVWKAHGKDDGNTVQMYRIIQSFGIDELDPNNPEDIEMANKIGLEFAEEMYADKQALIVTQADGDGGKLHNHVLINSVSFVDGKSLRGKRTGFVAVAEGTNDVMRKHGFKTEPVPGSTRDKRTIGELKMAQKGEYVWKDDLKERIRQGMAHDDVTSNDEFVRHMEEIHGVGVRFRGNAEGLQGDKIKGISYDFADENGKKRTSRASKLGFDYQSDVLTGNIENNIERKEKIVSDNEDSDVIDIGMDFDADLRAMRGTKTKEKKPTRSSGTNEIAERIQARRNMDLLHDEAKEIDVQFDEQKAEDERNQRVEMEKMRQDDLKHKQEVEQIEKGNTEG